MKLTSNAYDLLKPIALIYLPALATLYFAVASIWGIPDTTAVIGTMSAIDAFLGAVLGIASKSFTPPTDGEIGVNSAGLTGATLPDVTAEDVAAKRVITLKVVKAPEHIPPAV